MSNQNQNPGQQNQNPSQKPGQQQGGGQKPGQQQQDPNQSSRPAARQRIASSKVNQARAGKSRRKAGFFFVRSSGVVSAAGKPVRPLR